MSYCPWDLLIILSELILKENWSIINSNGTSVGVGRIYVAKIFSPLRLPVL